MTAPRPSALRVPFRAGGWRGEIAADLAPWMGRLGLTDPATLALRAVARAQGRGHALTIPLDQGHGFFRRYLHGGVLGAFTGDLFRGRRSLDEVRVLETLRARGAPCPEPLAAYEQDAGAGFYRLGILTRAIPGARAAPEVLRDLPAHDVAGRRRVLRALARAVRAFHDAGGDHADLNARNLVVDPAGQAWVLDLDRGKALPRPAPGPVRVRNLRRLARSWRKLDPEGRHVTPRDALAFCRAYAGGRLRGLPPGVADLGLPRRDPGGVLYEFAMLLLLPVVLAYLAAQRLTGGRLAESIPERLLWRAPPALPTRPILVHAASVGEVVSTTPLIRELRARFPGVPVVLSTLSEAGQARADLLGTADATTYLPLDLPGLPGRWLDALAPRLVVVLETELWNGLYRAIRSRGLPLATANMRIAPNRLARYRRLGWLFRPLLQVPDYLGTQSWLDRARVLELDAAPGRVRVPGDLKYDQVFENLHAPGRVRLAPVLAGAGPRLVAGSVHPGEDAQVLDAFLRVRAARPDARLTIAPRHLGKVGQVEAALRARELPYTLRSQLTGACPTPVLLLDTHGELALAYEGAAAAFVGGSLVPVGGHSPLEPAVFHVPVLHGPQAYNFTDMNGRLAEAGGAREVADGAGLAEAWVELLSDPEAASRKGEAAFRAARQLGGAAATIARHLRERWPDL